MTDNVKTMLEILKKREYRDSRAEGGRDISDMLTGDNGMHLRAIRFVEFLKDEQPRFFGSSDRFGFHRYCRRLIRVPRSRTFAQMGNITPNYARIIAAGLDKTVAEMKEKLKADPENKLYREGIFMFDALLAFAEKTRNAAEKNGNTRLAKMLETVPAKPAKTLEEAFLFMTVLHYALRGAGYDHMTLGRMDQYFYPYYLADIKRGATREELLETVELYFISLNFDTDLYSGIQQGDNGQSLVLGGYDADGNEMFNELSSLFMDASLELNLIDPKINMRVSSRTPDSLYEYGTRLTKKGLGFPQYSNDDVVVPALTALGYDRADALNYTVAACWEFLVPNLSFDIPNIETFNFPLIVNNAIRSHLTESETFDELMDRVDGCIKQECERIINKLGSFVWPPLPLLSLLVDGCMESGRDISEGGAKYNNFGVHGAGLSSAADALAAVREVIYDMHEVEKETLFAALDTDFTGYTELRNRLLDCPKMGNDDDRADAIGVRLMKAFSDNLNGKKTVNGNVMRAGTGSAMEYILSARKCPATADGRLNGAPYGCSFSPSPDAKVNGPLSVIKSFTKPDLMRACNGGPLTLEIHDTVFRNAEGEKKVAALVKLFVMCKGHQLQLNSVNRERLLAALEHPEEYRNLIVRVWGWSGYFNELDREYQDHVIKRTEYTL